jgi:hypothetical protein
VEGTLSGRWREKVEKIEPNERMNGHQDPVGRSEKAKRFPVEVQTKENRYEIPGERPSEFGHANR